MNKKPFVIPEGNVAFFDIDDTLIKWRVDKSKEVIKFVCRGHELVGNPIRSNIDELIVQALKGSSIVIWSRGGSDWGKAVVEGLGIEKYVDVITTKPTQLYDDLDPSVWLPKRRNLEEKNDGTLRA